MWPKKISVLLIAVFASLSVAAKDFTLETLLQAEKPTFDLSDSAKKISYYDLMHSKIGIKMQQLSTNAKPSSTNESELEGGRGASVKLSQNNYNIHINFPNGPEGGRSYGWTAGQVGDWSDKMYINKLFGIVSNGDKGDLGKFYELVIQMLGACNADGKDASIESLEVSMQRVAANFLAIYTAEEYRAMVPQPHKNWDDALLEVTMLGAFHGGQSKLTKFYLGEFSTKSKVQNSGVYAKTKPGPNAESAVDKVAEMNDYWQFSADPASKQSGINITRSDFEKMGRVITKYESEIAKNPVLDRIQAVVGGDGKNIIKSISNFFTNGKSKDLSKIDKLARDVSEFLMNVQKDADEITKWELQGE